jgi:hypothetical protein
LTEYPGTENGRGEPQKSPIEFVLFCLKVFTITINAKKPLLVIGTYDNGFWNSIHLQLVLSESNLCMTILLRSMVKLQAAMEILSRSLSLILARTVENQTGATPSASCQPASALNIHPLLAGKSQVRLIKRAHLSTLPFERKKQSAHARLATGNILRVTVPHLSALCGSMMVRGAKAVKVRLTGIKNIGVNANPLDKLAG